MNRSITFIFDLRTSDELVFFSIRQEFSEQCLNLVHLFHIYHFLPSKCELRVSLKVLLHGSVEVLLRNAEYTATDSTLLSGITAAFHKIRERTPLLLPEREESAAALARRLKPLHIAWPSTPAETTLQRQDQNLVFIISSFLSYSDLFTYLSHTAKTSHAEESAMLHRVHCVSVDGDAVCVTTASCGAPALHGEHRLYRTSPDPCDVRFALQSSLAPFFFADSRVSVALRLSGVVEVLGTARRPYLADLRRCALPEDFLHIQKERHNLCFLKNTVCQSPFEVPRGDLSHPEASASVTASGQCDTSIPVNRLYLEAVLHPDLVDEVYLYGDPWVLSPADAHQYSAWHQLFQVFEKDVMLFRTTDAHLHSTHRLVLQQSCFIAFFKDHTHLVLREVIPSEIRREIISNSEGGTTGFGKRMEDPVLLQQMRSCRNDVLQRSTSSTGLRELLSGGVGLVASQLSRDSSYTLDVLQYC